MAKSRKPTRTTKQTAEDSSATPKRPPRRRARKVQSPDGVTAGVGFDEPGLLVPEVASLAITRAAAASGSPKDLRAVRLGIEKLLIRQAGPQVRGMAAAASSLEAEGNIVGVGETLGDPLKGAAPGEQSLVVYTVEKTTEDKIKGHLSNARAATDESLARTRMRVYWSGVVEAQAHRFSANPAPCGISVGHSQVTAGTLGVLARGRSGQRVNRLFGISNNHVFANANQASEGDRIVQPGVADGGGRNIGVLERFVRIDFSPNAQNVVDCACAWMTSSAVDREFVYLVNGAQQRFKVSPQTVPAVYGMQVGKSGRTTQVTQGWINATSVTINVSFGQGAVATFVNQFSILSVDSRRAFSQGGDSGSLIWSWNPQRNPVGLLFAGGTGVTFANPINTVLNALDLQLYV